MRPAVQHCFYGNAYSRFGGCLHVAAVNTHRSEPWETRIDFMASWAVCAAGIYKKLRASSSVAGYVLAVNDYAAEVRAAAEVWVELLCAGGVGGAAEVSELRQDPLCTGISAPEAFGSWRGSGSFSFFYACAGWLSWRTWVRPERPGGVYIHC